MPFGQETIKRRLVKSRFRLGLVALGIALAPCGGVAEAQDQAVLVRGGTLRMGTPSSAIPGLKTRYGVEFPGAFESEAPDHLVTLGDFLMDRHEVTNQRFAQFVAARPEWSRGRLPPETQNGRYLEHWKDGKCPPAKLDHPVVFVTWHAAQAYCRWGHGRLPSEAEWEYAARAGGDIEFPWGDDLPSAARANYSASGVGDTKPVGSYPPNALGLHDMAGNVWEFLLDRWEPTYAAGHQVDPIAGGAVSDDVRGVAGRGSSGAVATTVASSTCARAGVTATSSRTRWASSGFDASIPPAGQRRRNGRRG
jgi:formylglycine-generating enzyme required for sulfatase activity